MVIVRLAPMNGALDFLSLYNEVISNNACEELIYRVVCPLPKILQITDALRFYNISIPIMTIEMANLFKPAKIDFLLCLPKGLRYL